MSDLYRRCGCRDANGKQYPTLPEQASAEHKAKACPKLVADPKHGKWGYSISNGFDPMTKRRRQIRKATFTTKKAAQQERNKVAAKVDKGSYLPPTKQTFAAYLIEWLPRHSTTGRGLKPSTVFNYSRYIDADIAPSALGAMKLSDIRRHNINAFVTTLLKDGRGVTTVRRIVAVIQSALRSAYEDQLIEDNPAIGLRLPRVDRHELKTWTPEQVGVFLDTAAEHRLGALFEVALFTGMRRGELLGLRWDDVDLERQLVTIRHNRVQVGAHAREETPKTKSGARTVDIADSTVGVLIAWKLAQDAEAADWGDAWQGDGHVFTYEDGRALMPQYVTRLFDKITVKTGLPKMTFHGQRHLAASLMIDAGVPIAVISKRLGHASIQITSDRYGHLIGSASRNAAELAVALVPRKASAHTLHTHAA